MRFLYTLVMYLAMPLLLLRLAVRGMRHGGYHRRWPERFGFFRRPDARPSLWLHAVSLGEVNAAEPLITALLAQYPDTPLVVTTGTPTGSQRVHQLFGDAVFHVYLPFDLPFAVRRFLRRVRPRLGVIVETEIWPNLFYLCRRRGTRLLIANARLSSRSLRGYVPVLKSLMKSVLGCVTHVAAQSQLDAARYRLLGATGTKVTVVGNLKFDMPVKNEQVARGSEFRRRWGSSRPVWMAASTHAGEEEAALQAHIRVLKHLPDALLLLAPRHPERFPLVERLVRDQGFVLATRQVDVLPQQRTQCLVIDALGELLAFYAAADVAFVGGSLVPVGGHNILEPAALGVPVLVGPHTHNFEGITNTLLKQQAVRRVESAGQLGNAVLQLLRDDGERQRMGAAARHAFEQERGAVGRVMALIAQELEALEPTADHEIGTTGDGGSRQ